MSEKRTRTGNKRGAKKKGAHDELTPRALAYKNERISNPTKSKKQCAIDAGYSAKAAHFWAYRLEQNPLIAEAIEAAQKAAAEKAQITLEEIVDELKPMGFANMGDYLEFLENGGVAIDWSNLTREQTAAIAEVTIDEYMDGRGEDARLVKRVKFKLHDKRSSLVEIAKLLNLEPAKKVDLTSGGERLQVTLNLGGTVSPDDEDAGDDQSDDAG